MTTKVITNNKRTAMTVQYWEVLRKFRIQSEVEGWSLVCFVPLDLVRSCRRSRQSNVDPTAWTRGSSCWSAIPARLGTATRSAPGCRPAIVRG